MGKKYVIGDIHGNYLGLIEILKKCNFDYDNDLLITLGDIVDGWPDSFLVIEELLKIKNRIDVVGNHDDFFMKFLNTGINPDGWSQGGLATAKSYAKGVDLDLKVTTIRKKMVRGFNESYLLNLIPEDIPESHINFFKRQVRYYKDENNNIFVHGGFDRHFEINECDRDYLIWDRNLFSQALSAKSGKNKLKFKESNINNIFLGHTSTIAWNTDKPINADIIWNLDTGSGWNGKLTIMNVVTKEYFQSDNSDKLYDPIYK